MKSLEWLLLFTSLATCLAPVKGQIYKVLDGNAYFKSDAPLELIEANSRKLQGAIDTEKRTFAFTIPIQSFKGFNSDLQRVHFNENYLESHDFPNATFRGKIIEKIDFRENGRFEVRAKGKFEVHGVEQERIIKSQLEIINGRIKVSSEFTVLIEEHKIRVPKVVNQKIAKEIYVSIEAEFEK